MAVISVDKPRPPPSAQQLLVAPVRAWISDEASGEPLDKGRPNTPERDELPRGRCPRGTCNPFRFLLPFAHRLAECYYAMQREEGARRARLSGSLRADFRYATVLRVRPDHMFLRPMPPVHASAGWLGMRLSAGRVLLWDDQVAVARRDEAPAILLAPTLAYASCADDSQWELAVRAGGSQVPSDWSMAKCRGQGDIPCPAMALIAAHGAVTTWRHLPLLSKPWQRAASGEIFSPSNSRIDFCLKRERFTNETTDGQNGRSPEEIGLAC